ncbi:DgyrCDS8059 [Dimorphilus gyrociliatus]|uniref:DgyrCDS8059 n=1 Tax=Dimorphilus gyrociliatus TaxID=2664684 RepID=A0A7I8VT30_9ANNE|nr:DgyrCDS8059 [Dimorphilus gyrociliatus]
MISQLAKFLFISCITIYPSGIETNDVTNLTTVLANEISTISTLKPSPTVVENSTAAVTSNNTITENSTTIESFSDATTITSFVTTNNSTSFETTIKFIPSKKKNHVSLKIFLVIVAVGAAVAVVAIIIGKRHCCNAMKTNITAKFNVKKDSELEYIIDDGEFMNPDDPPVLAEMKVAPNGKRKKAKKEETLNSLSGKNKDGSLQLYGATTSAALPC